jgi:hypothetical protein
MQIFISSASYRDPELLPTVLDCLAKAQHPDRIVFGICWQHGDDELLPEPITKNPQFKILDVAWKDSKGACWARSQIQKLLYAGEDFYFQLDSHHRFVQDWDSKLIE